MILYVGGNAGIVRDIWCAMQNICIYPILLLICITVWFGWFSVFLLFQFPICCKVFLFHQSVLCRLNCVYSFMNVDGFSLLVVDNWTFCIYVKHGRFYSYAQTPVHLCEQHNTIKFVNSIVIMCVCSVWVDMAFDIEYIRRFTSTCTFHWYLNMVGGLTCFLWRCCDAYGSVRMEMHTNINNHTTNAQQR